MKKRLTKSIKLFSVIMGACILLCLVIPNQGPLALLKEFMIVMILLGWTVCGAWGAVFILKNRKGKMVYRLREHWLYEFLLMGVCAVLCCILAVGCVSDLSKDVAQGPQTMVLKNCEISHSHRPGIFRSYKLKGTTADGERITFTISASDYYRLEKKHTAWSGNWTTIVVGYRHTGRVIRLP